MTRLTQIPLLIPVAVLCLGVMAVEGWLIQQSRWQAAQALLTLNLRKQERDGLMRQAPALSPENEAAVFTDLAAAGHLFAEWRSILQGDGPDGSAEAIPARSIDAFFELTSFVGQLRVEAAQAQMGLKPNERFGFATHANEGPPAGQLAAVYRQRLAIQRIVEMLLESRPYTLLAVRRERPGAEAARELRSRADDFFELDRTWSVRQPGLVDSDAFRFEFTGQTGTLRQFLNRLGNIRQPFVVRNVEVEPLVVDNLPRVPTQAAITGAPVPLVKPGILRFGVTLELARLTTNLASAP